MKRTKQTQKLMLKNQRQMLSWQTLMQLKIKKLCKISSKKCCTKVSEESFSRSQPCSSVSSSSKQQSTTQKRRQHSEPRLQQEFETEPFTKKVTFDPKIYSVFFESSEAASMVCTSRRQRFTLPFSAQSCSMLITTTKRMRTLLCGLS